jgi:replicative superfamily II helicase
VQHTIGASALTAESPVTMPTFSAPKAWHRAKNLYYTAPLKALVSEKFFALCQAFGAENVGMVTGDSGTCQAQPRCGSA